jgi:putative endonuclease
MYFVYILLCDDGSLYTGITTDVERRFVEHKSKNGGRYTRSRGVTKIVYTEQHKNRSAALKREAEIKKWRREQKMELARVRRSRAQ